MAKRTPPTHPRVQRQIEALGQRLRVARMRRSMTQEVMAERVGVSVPTIAKLEKGDPSTSLATVLRALTVLGLAGDIDLIAAQDTLGRELQDNALRRTNASPRTRTTSTPLPPPVAQTPPVVPLLPTPSVPPRPPRPRKPKP
ncbi:helix-turn-helix domain-containing protein [Luteibacter jiangsuensis]|uniref:Helix-turn-helix domain-containing protein n=1 Tax=Luteibacter jiangsuensis TaxID=637577 RepID=A0ABX0Q1N5_9GAMM|nr:helix-turn-helix domain-containing protein [Luteibacter jiangsuensis]NID04252.1 helix-turn-helix domain-containing protein [Luteibacter jiangsuensis]